MSLSPPARFIMRGFLGHSNGASSGFSQVVNRPSFGLTRPHGPENCWFHTGELQQMVTYPEREKVGVPSCLLSTAIHGRHTARKPAAAAANGRRILLFPSDSAFLTSQILARSVNPK